MHRDNVERRGRAWLMASSARKWRRPPKPTRGLLVVLLAGLLIGGCAVLEKDRRAVALQNATNGYQAALRWGYYETAFGFLQPAERNRLELPDMFNDLRVTGYDVVQRPTIQGDDGATQIVVIDYLFEDDQIVKRLTDRQVWRWDDPMGAWWLHSGLPRFKSGGAGTETR